MEKIEVPTKEGFVFSHWSLENPENGGSCPPVNFDMQTFNDDTTLYAVFKKEVHVSFVSDGVEVQNQTVVKGGRAQNPIA